MKKQQQQQQEYQQYEQVQQVEEIVTPTEIGTTSTGNVNRYMKKVIKPEYMKFLDIKAEETPPQSSSQTVQDEEVFPPGSLAAQIASSLGTQENISYFSKVDLKSHQVLLVPTKEMRGVSLKRISTKGAKHKDLCEGNRYYCENCPCNYS